MKILTTIYLLIFLVMTGHAQHKNLVLSYATTFKNQQGDLFLAIYYKNKTGWHTYWKNPGDAGTPFKHQFTVNNQKVVLPEYEWPAPKKYYDSLDTITYGYSGTYGLYFPLNKEIQKKLNGQELVIKSRWLVCKEICIPGEKTFKGRFLNEKFTSSELSSFKLSQKEQMNLFNKIPQLTKDGHKINIFLSRTSRPNELVLTYSIKEITPDKIINKVNLLTPFPATLFTFKHEKLYMDKKNTLYGRVLIDWDGEYAENGPIPLPEDGFFKNNYKLKFIFANPWNQKQEVFEKTFPSFSVKGIKTQEKFVQALIPLEKIGKKKSLLKKVNNKIY